MKNVGIHLHCQHFKRFRKSDWVKYKGDFSVSADANFWGYSGHFSMDTVEVDLSNFPILKILKVQESIEK